MQSPACFLTKNIPYAKDVQSLIPRIRYGLCMGRSAPKFGYVLRSATNDTPQNIPSLGEQNLYLRLRIVGISPLNFSNYCTHPTVLFYNIHIISCNHSFELIYRREFFL